MLEKKNTEYAAMTETLLTECEELIKDTMKVSDLIDLITDDDSETSKSLMKALKLYKKARIYSIRSAQKMDELTDKLEQIEEQNNKILKLLEAKKEKES